jgi:hypothetical protein
MNTLVPGHEWLGTALKGFSGTLCLLSTAVIGFAQQAAEDPMRSIYVLG